MNHRLVALAVAASVCLLPRAAWGASPNHPGRNWTVLETPHFSVHYYQGEELTARRMAEAAEEALPRLSKDFGVEVCEKIPIVVSRDNFFNGSAEPVKTRIQLDPLLAASSVIGTERFVTHELAHVVSFLALQSDLPISRLNNLGTMPTWFLEGIAQYEAEYWYATNDRMLRLNTLKDSLLTSTERENFPLLGVVAGAAGYNEGYSLTRFIFDTHGKDKIAELFRVLRRGEESTFARALEKVTGQSFSALQAAWKDDLKQHYAKQTEGISEQVSGSLALVAPARSEVNVQPRLSPDGKRLAYLSSRNQDGYLYLRGHVMGFLTLTLADADGRNPREVPVGKGRVSGFCWSPDGKQLVVSAVSANADGEPTFELYLHDLDTRQTRQLTDDANASDPAWRPGTSWIAYVTTRDGKTRLVLHDVKSDRRQFVPAEGLGDRHPACLAWSPKGDRLAASIYATGEGGKIATIDPESGHVRALTEGGAQTSDRDPAWAPDGKSLVFSSDRDGMHNLYRLTMTGRRELKQLTKVYTGATHPCFGPDGKLYYVAYRAVGSEVRAWAPNAGEALAYQVPRDLPSGVKVASTQVQTPTLGRQLPEAWSMRAYEPTMTSDLIMPQLASDERGSQLGVLALYSDILNKQQLGMDVRMGIMSQRFSYSAQYLNRMSAGTWGATLYDTPTVGMASVIDPAHLSDSLYWSRERGVSLFGQTQLGASQALTAAVGLAHLSVLDPPRGGTGLGLREGRVQTLSLAWADQRVKGTLDSDLNPSDGYQVGASYTLSDRAFGSDFNFSQVAAGASRYFPVFPEWRHNLAWNWRVMLNAGEAMPLFLGGVMGGGPITPLRGYNVGSFAGDSLAYSGLEYTFPIHQHLDHQFGPLYLNKIYASAFVEAGDAWTRQEAAFNPHATTGAELRVKTAFMGRQVVIFRLGVARKLTADGVWGMYLAF
ncbi:MAG TPA: BamA/TamA family outer membrane protein [Pantanalinema sp.]